MDDLWIFLLAVSICGNVYAIATIQRHERALQFFQDQLQRRDHVVTWEELNGDDD
ncbi:MAG: hypothetical protein KDE47_32840 [Caldilineaceae bacterium]|nr:hypothetical protein [Caldilineaceae bacterium]